MSSGQLRRGDCLEQLRQLDADSIDAIVTDPPAGIGFMGKAWDHDKGGRRQWTAWMESVMTECLRVLKPGGHALIWAIPRTSHWTATAIEDAGFEVRDVVTHHFGSGFPKSLDVSKAIDKAAGAEREVVGRKADPRYRSPVAATSGSPLGNIAPRPNAVVNYEKAGWVTAPATEAARQWQGWGTALKPASEHWILARKPLAEPNVASNVLEHGTGALNIDGCRVGSDVVGWGGAAAGGNTWNEENCGLAKGGDARPVTGRFPANLILSHSDMCEDGACHEPCPVAEMDRQSGITKSGFMKAGTQREGIGYHGGLGTTVRNDTHGDSGGASRFFYVAKAPKRDRGEGNTHPTVKSTVLMAYLCRLVTPPGGTVLDPFMGSGSTGVAALREGFRFIGIEREAEYYGIAKTRIRAEKARLQGHNIAKSNEGEDVA